MRALLIYILLGACGLQGVSQIIYISIYSRLNNYGYDIFKINLYDCSSSLECDKIPNRQFAIRPVTNEFVMLETGRPFGFYEMDYCNAVKWGGPINNPNPVLRFFHDGYDSDRYGFIFGIGEDGIFKVNPPSPYFEYKGPLDPYIRNKGLLSHHTAYTGHSEFYATDTNNLVNNWRLLGFDTANPSQWRVVFDFPHGMRVIDIIELHQSCGDQSIAVLTGNDEYYSLNLSSKVFKYLCTINFSDPRYYQRDIHGSSIWMYKPQDCDVFIDLDINNSSGDKMNGFTNSLNCNNPFPFLSDDDPDVFSDYGTMDSIVIQMLNPIDGNAEQLQITQSFGSQYRTDAFSLSLIPSLLTTNDSFELAIRNLKYMNTSCIPTMGSRFIRFIAYKNQISDTAYATINLTGPFYHAGTDNAIQLCKNDSSINLQNYLGTCYSPGGTWSGPTHLANDLLDPNSALDGTYYYIVGDSICGYDSAHILINIFEPPEFSLPSDTSLCSNDFLDLAFNFPNAMFFWSDGDTLTSKSIRKPGIYWLSIQNEAGCFHRDTFSVDFLPLSTFFKDTFICQNLSLEYEGRNYRPGDVIKDTLTGILSCDTILTLHVRGLPIPLPSLIADSLVCPNQLSRIQTSIPYPIYLWSNSSTQSDILVSPGTYNLTVTDYNGCSNSSSITIRQVPPLDYQIVSRDPKCFGETGSIQVDVLSGGAPGFHYFLNGSLNLTGIFDQVSPGNYSLSIIDAEACMVQDTVSIQDGNELLVQMKQSIDLLLNQSAVIPFSVLKGSVKDIWSVPSTNIRLLSGDKFEINTGTDQTLTIFFADHSGCVYSIPLIIKILRNDKTYFPNAFSPNGDQINDLWIPYIGSDYKFIKLSIFDRWGNLIYISTTDPVWNGRTSNGQLANPGVYIYSIHVQSNISGPKLYSGDISIVK